MTDKEERIAHLMNVVDLQAKEIDSLKELQKSRTEAESEMMDRIREFLTSFPFALIVINRNQTIHAVNQLAEKYFHYSVEELAGRSITIVFPDIKSLEPTGKPIRTFGQRKGGEQFAVEVFVSVLGIRGDDRLFVSVQDVTERHRLENLRQDLISMVSHDLRAPLSSIRMALDLVLDGTYGELNQRGRNVLERAISSTTYLNSLVSNLLDAEKAENSGIKVEFHDTTVGAIVDHALRSLGTLENQSVTVETDYTNDALEADRDRIAQVLINLISNAVRFSPDNGKVIVKAGIEGLSVKFQVIDQGPGVPAEMQTKIFEKYTQVKQPKGSHTKGFGLGLAICKALVEQHHGRIWVSSTAGNGSSFTFEIPIAQEHANEPE